MRSATIANYLDPWHPSSHCGSFISINHPATLHRSQDVKQGPEAGRLHSFQRIAFTTSIFVDERVAEERSGSDDPQKDEPFHH